jgi:hypothetical protein
MFPGGDRFNFVTKRNSFFDRIAGFSGEQEVFNH